jgi:type VI protein secretion system component VasK
MTEVLVVLAAIGLIWAVWVAYILLSDWHARRTNADALSMREWRDKVDAFRRLTDQDGDA